MKYLSAFIETLTFIDWVLIGIVIVCCLILSWLMTAVFTVIYNALTNKNR